MKSARKMNSFFKECYAELQKVSWPNRESVIASTKIVLAATVLAAVFFGFIDWANASLVSWIYG